MFSRGVVSHTTIPTRSENERNNHTTDLVCQRLPLIRMRGSCFLISELSMPHWVRTLHLPCSGLWRDEVARGTAVADSTF